MDSGKYKKGRGKTPSEYGIKTSPVAKVRRSSVVKKQCESSLSAKTEKETHKTLSRQGRNEASGDSLTETN